MIEIKDLRGGVLYASESAADVREALEEAVRSGAVLHNARLDGANLRGSDLSGVRLSGSNLRAACLSGLILYGADLSHTDLSHTDLRGADLSHTDLRGADLSHTDLRGVNLLGSDLRGASLYGSNLRGAYLPGSVRGALLADLALARTRILPEGDIIGWKKCRDGRIVKLRIPDGVARSHADARKCRAAQAEVLAIYDKDGAPADTAGSLHDPWFVYRVGETACPTEPFDTDPWKECASGIHFYITRAEAEAHA